MDYNMKTKRQHPMTHPSSSWLRMNKVNNSSIKATSMRIAPLLCGFLLLSIPGSQAATYDVTPDGGSDSTPYSLASALQKAGPGDTISLSDGTYKEALVTVQGGEEGSPLKIVGGRGAEINGHSNEKVVFVQHSWVSLEGFTVNGKVDDADESSSYASKCVYVQGLGEESTVTYDGVEVKTGLIGFSMDGMEIKNCGGECVRLKDFVTNAALTNNVVSDCGVYAYVYNQGGKNGEAFYVGTSSKQWTDGEDECRYNVISGNTIIPNGNECVDIKEGSTDNIVENNDCSGQLDESSGCFGSRGDANTFRYNTASDCLGAGVRLGGWEVDGYQYGQDNNVYGNDFTETGTGVLSVKAVPQGQICGNTCSDGTCGIIGDDVDDVEASWDQPCEGVEDDNDDLTAIPLTTSDGPAAPTTPSPIIEPDTPQPTGTPIQSETEAPVTPETPETPAPVTPVPTTTAPVTPSPQTPAPVTESPSTPTPSTPVPTTQAPVLTSPETPAPVTESPSTPTPSTPVPTQAPVLGSSETPAPATPLSETPSPVTSSSSGGEESFWECDAVEMSTVYVTATLATQDGYPASNAVDGDPSSRWSAEGAGAWLSFELPEATALSGIAISFEDGNERQQRISVVSINTAEVAVELEVGSGTTEGAQYFSFENPKLYAKSIVLVGYGNTINDWNSITEVTLCKADTSTSRKLTRTSQAPDAARARRSLRGSIAA